MKSTLHLAVVASVFIGSTILLTAHNLRSLPTREVTNAHNGGSKQVPIALSTGSHFLPPVARTDENGSARKKGLSTHGALTLKTSTAQPYQVSSGDLQSGLVRLSAVYQELDKPEMDKPKLDKPKTNSDCSVIALSMEQLIKSQPSGLLEIIEAEISGNPSCACEIVKAAIIASNADTNQVAAIVETAITAAPDSMRLISQCAIAVAPDSLASVQALLTRLDPNAGDSDYSGKSAKSAKGAKFGEVAAIYAPAEGNPLDVPPAAPPLPPLPPLPPISPPPVTEVNPSGLQF